MSKPTNMPKTTSMLIFMTLRANEPAGFWSYVHADDEGEEGRILRLCELLKKEYRLLTGGDEIRMFVDTDLEWGDKWKETIDQAITTTTFFIAIVTPSYLRSEQCRRELFLFAQNAAVRKVPNLLLPILYSEVDDLTSDSKDEVKAAIAQAQYEPFTHLRLQDQKGQEYREAVNKLAKRLIRITKSVDEAPEYMPKPIGKNSSSPATEEDYDDSPGLLDAMADAEELFPEWKLTMDSFTEKLESLTEVTQKFNPLMVDASKKNSGAKLVVTKRFAKEMLPEAMEFRDIGFKYAEQALKMNGNIITILTQIESRTPEELSDPDVLGFLNSTRDLAVTGRNAIESVQEFQDSARHVATLSRDIRKPLLIISEGAQSFLDGQLLFDDWKRRIDGIIGESTDTVQDYQPENDQTLTNGLSPSVI